MAKTQFSFTVVAQLVCEHTEGAALSNHVASNYFLDVSPNLRRETYIDEDGLPTIEANKPITNTLLSVLSGHIHRAHQNGSWDSADHYRYVLAELERMFLRADVQVIKGEM